MPEPERMSPSRLTVAFDAIQARFDASEPISVGGIGELLDAWYEERERIAELESKLARWRKVARAAVLWRRPPKPFSELWADEQLIEAVDALAELERAELLEEFENG